MTSSTLDLIEFAYGKGANLYEDVLKVSRNSSKDEIQTAFINRRYELYELIQQASIDGSNANPVNDNKGQLISVSERCFAEKKMDALVGTFRILNDPLKRREYNTKLNAAISNSSEISPNCVIPSYDTEPLTDETLEEEELREFDGSFVNEFPPHMFESIDMNNDNRDARRQLFTNQNWLMQTPPSPTEITDSLLPSLPSKHSHKRRTRSRQKIEYSPTLPSTRMELFHDENQENQPSRVNIDNYKPNKETNDEKNTSLEDSFQQPLYEKDDDNLLFQSESHHHQVNRANIEYNSKQKLKTKVKSPVHTHTKDTAKIEIDSFKKNESATVANIEDATERRLKEKRLKEKRSKEKRSKGKVTWIDRKEEVIQKGGKKSKNKRNHNDNEQYEKSKNWERNHVENDQDEDVIVNSCTGSSSLVGFLRSSGFENQAFILEEINNEVRGSIADTLLAVDQVLNAFTIADDDINAVIGNIRNANNEFSSA